MSLPLYRVLLLLPLLVLLSFPEYQVDITVAPQVFASSTPTYDPLAEPPLPSNPTEYELGRNLYWHWCMTCHGDRGQGLTDEFRGIWEPDHQNCWGRGCHAGHPGDTGFPIPTVVPALVSEAHFEQFASVQELSDFLETTHPPQSPGILEKDEYHAIALFVFTMNERPLVSDPAMPTPVVAPSSTPIPSPVPALRPFPSSILLIIVILMLAVFGLARSTRFSNRGG